MTERTTPPRTLDLALRILNKMASRQRLGWIDYSSDSYDVRVANARAQRIKARLRGERMTLNQALHA